MNVDFDCVCNPQRIAPTRPHAAAQDDPKQQKSQPCQIEPWPLLVWLLERVAGKSRPAQGAHHKQRCHEDQHSACNDQYSIHDRYSHQQDERAQVQGQPNIPARPGLKAFRSPRHQIRQQAKDELGQHTQGDQVHTQPAQPAKKWQQVEPVQCRGEGCQPRQDQI